MTGLARIVGRSVIGALWGALGAVWLLEPLLLGAQHLVPRTASHWLLVHALMTAIGAAFGAAAAVPIGACLTLWGHGRRRLAHDVEWHLALAIGPLLVPTWLLMSYVLQVVLVRSFAAPGWDVVGPAIGLTALFGAINGWVYRRVACRVPRPRVRMLAGLLIAGLGAGAVLHPLRFGMGALAVAYDDAPLVRVGAGRAAPLLVVGIDGANWRTLEPLLQQGRLPTLARLLRQGVQGEMHASWSPYWSSPAWAAMMTGYAREANGWYGDLAVVAPGLPPFDAPQERYVVLDPIHLLQWGLAMADVIRFVPPARDVLQRCGRSDPSDPVASDPLAPRSIP